MGIPINNKGLSRPQSPNSLDVRAGDEAQQNLLVAPTISNAVIPVFSNIAEFLTLEDKCSVPVISKLFRESEHTQSVESLLRCHRRIEDALFQKVLQSRPAFTSPQLEELELIRSPMNDGQLADFIRRFPNLRFLTLSSARNLTDGCMESVGTLRKLESLSIMRCGWLNAAGLAHIADLPIRSLDFSVSANITDAALAPISSLRNLEILKLAWAKRLTDEALVYLQGLPIRDLDLSAIGGLTNDGLTLLERLPFLETLVLRKCSISGKGLMHVGKLPHLKALDISQCISIRDEDLPHLRRLPLKKLELESCESLTDAGFEHLKELPLEVLNLVGTVISDRGLRHIEEIPTLRSINLRTCGITDQGVSRLLERGVEVIR